jgi:LacI family transcriptional regulator
MAARHLIELGHRRIACLTGPVNLFSSRHRLEGCRKALEESGLALDGLVVQGDFRPNSGYQGLIKLMGQPDPPMAVFASNDMMAIGALRAASELGLRVPGDLSMIGFDDLEITHLSSLQRRTAKDEIGRAAVQLDRNARGKPPRVSGLIPPSCKRVNCPAS